MTANPPMTHEISAAGPAIVDALSAPKSQPDPMIEPTDVNSSPTTPISRRSRGAPAAAARGPRSVGALASIVDTVSSTLRDRGSPTPLNTRCALRWDCVFR